MGVKLYIVTYEVTAIQSVFKGLVGPIWEGVVGGGGGRCICSGAVTFAYSLLFVMK